MQQVKKPIDNSKIPKLLYLIVASLLLVQRIGKQHEKP